MNPPQLIVTVRDAHEARLVLRAVDEIIVRFGASPDVALDVKEPTLGALGRAEVDVVDGILDEVRGRLPISVAWGELRDWDHGPPARWQTAVRLVKLGLAGMALCPDWDHAWRRATVDLQRVAGSVAVAYADWPSCGAPAPHVVVQQAVRLGCDVVLLDTYDKTLGPLACHLRSPELVAVFDRVRTAQMHVAVAGSLTLGDLPWVLKLAPDFVAVRGALCGSNRSGPLIENRVKLALLEWLRLVGNRSADGPLHAAS